jgi:DNA-directed RNA polymerase alpha subunit
MLDYAKCKFLAEWLTQHIRNMEIDKELYNADIQHLDLSNRTMTVLRTNNIVSVGELLNRAVNWDQIRVLKGAGTKVLQEIKEKVDELRKIHQQA